MQLNFVDEDCGSFVISSKLGGKESASNNKGIMTEAIHFVDKKIETRGETKEFSE